MTQLTKKIEKEVLQVYDTWLHSYLNGDVATYDFYFDEDYHFIGSTDNEEFLSRKDTTKFFEKTAEQLAGKCDLRKETRILEQFGELVFITHVFDAWFLSGTDYSYYGRFRFSNILRKNKDGWRFIYQHFSTPDSKTEEGDTIGFDKINAENQELREAIKRRTFELEQKNRELEIETALERIRAQVTGMEKSEDLLDIVVSMRNEFVRLGHEAHYFWHMRWHPEKYEKAMTSGDGTRIGMVMELPRRIHGEIKALAEWEKSDEPTVIFPMDVDVTLDYVHKMVSWGDFERLDPNMPTEDDIRHIGGLTYVMARTSLGEIGYSLPGVVKDVSQTDLDILVRFARAFDLAHKRFEDLKISERQARETQIELALEKVRSRTMAMRQSEELTDVVKLLYQECDKLNINNESTDIEIGLIDEATGIASIWAHFYQSDGSISSFKLPLNNFEELANEFRQWKATPVSNRHDLFFTTEYSGAAKESMLQSLAQLPELAEIFHPLTEANIPKWVTHNAYFSHGFLTLQGMEHYSPETLEIQQRFAKAFEQTYTRFLDLQSKEEQAVKLREEKERLEKTLRDLQATQKQLIHSEKMASLGELTAGIAHEIQNPLNFVNNFSEVSNELVDEMNEEIENGDLEEVKAIARDIKQNLEKINHHGKRADEIVKGMLQHSRKSTGEKTPTDINKLADEYLRLAYHGLRAKDKSFNATLNTDFDPTLEKVMVIPQDIGRVVLNLFTNAFYAVNEKKKNSGNGYQPTVTISTKKFTDHITIAVKDNGNGIPQPVLDKIFQPFFTTKPTGQGTGLGLSLSYDIVKAHGGKITINSQENIETEFTIFLPLVS